MNHSSLTPGDQHHPVSLRSVALIAIGFLFWTVYPLLSQYNLDQFRDMLENYAWGIRWQWGNSKHPPLFGWLTAAWFEVFPRNDVSYRAFAAFNIAVSLGLMLAIARRFLAPPLQDVAVLTAFVLPLLGFAAFTYNANSAMLPFWAATVLFYLRVLENRRLTDAVLLGLFSAGAMLCKYYSAVLLLALAIHALSHRDSRAILLSLLAIAAGASFVVVVAPHIAWLVRNDFSPILFAADGQGESSLSAQAYRQAEFVLAQIVYVLPGLAIMGLMRRPRNWRPLFDVAQMREVLGSTHGQVLLWASIGTVPIAMVAAFAASSPLTSNWSMPAFIMVPVLLAAMMPLKVATEMRNWSFGLAIGFMALMLALSPFIRSAIIAESRLLATVPIHDLAQQAEQVWREQTGRELAFVGGDTYADFAVAFYGDARPQTLEGPDLQGKPWIDQDTLVEQGALVVCQSAGCIDAWNPETGWMVRPLGQVTAPAPDGAGGAAAYTVHMWQVERINREERP